MQTNKQTRDFNYMTPSAWTKLHVKMCKDGSG